MANYATSPQLPVSQQPGAPQRTDYHLTKAQDDEFRNPWDEWGSRDILLSLVPMFVVFAFKDAALNAALAFGIGWSGALLLIRFVLWDGRYKMIWPCLEISNIIMFAILRGITSRWYYQIHKWVPVIVPLAYILVVLHVLVWRRPFSAYHARYPKTDKSGRGIFKRDKHFRFTADIIDLAWCALWAISLLLSLIPILTGYWFTWHALNIIFNYVVPFALMILGLVIQQLLGRRYRQKAAHTADTHYRELEMNRGGAGVGQPAGEIPTAPALHGPPATHTTGAYNPTAPGTYSNV